MGGGDDNGDRSQPRGAKRPLSAVSKGGGGGGGRSGGGKNDDEDDVVPLYLAEGLFAVRKPLGWTSQDVVGKLRRALEADAKDRGAPDRRTKRRRPWMKVGHGGTLDPLATGVLVCGVGSGTKNLQKYLVGSKAYRAEVTLGYQTTTLDADPSGSIEVRKPYDHVTSLEEIDIVLRSKFTGKISQIPPVFSALKRDGKKMYELAREGKTAEDLGIKAREVTIYDLKIVGLDDDGGGGGTTEKKGKEEDAKRPIEKFVIDVECGGGTYIRSLVRDIGLALGTVATMTKLERTKQGRFLPEHCLRLDDGDDDDVDEQRPERDDEGNILPIASDDDEEKKKKDRDRGWTVSAINAAIRSCSETVLKDDDDDDDGLR